MKKTLILLCLLALMITVLVSCTTGTTGTDGSSDSTSDTVVAGPSATTPEGDILFMDAGQSLYQVTYPMGANKHQITGAAFSDALTALRKAIKGCGYTGTSLFPIKSDEIPFSQKDNFTPPEYEILVGDTNRPESIAIEGTLAYNEAVIRVVGNKVCIFGYNDTLTVQALYEFIEEYLVEGTTQVVIPKTLDKKIYLDLTYNRELDMTYEAMAKEVFKSFNDEYWQANRLPKGFQTNEFWQSAETLETYIDVYEATKTEANKTKAVQLAGAFARTFRSDWSWNEFNDDIMWACIAMTRLTLLTGDTKWAEYAKSNFDKCYASEVNTALGGGMFWKKDHQSKNACVNGPAAIAACLLAQYTGDNTYYDKAKALIDWQVEKLYDKSNGKVFDSISIQGKTGTWASTYNQGTFLGACTFLWKHFNDETYLGYATKAADYAVKKLTSGGIIDNGEASLDNGDLPGFKAILVRWLYRFAKETNNVDYLVFLQNNAAKAYENRNADGLIWTNWKGKTPETKDLTRENGYVPYGMQTAVALMYNCQQWWK